jgi:hypothetical protein
MHRLWLTLSLLAIAGPLWPQGADIYDEKVTSAGNIGATISNLGIIGNSFSGSFNVLGYPSCEYPVNSGIEHIFEGGLWVGGVRNGQTLVTTGAVDASSGYSTGAAGFEFASSNPLGERSALFDSPFYNPLAVSHQDFFSTFTDTALFLRTATNRIPIQEHLNPLGIKVDFQSYNWNFAFANFFVILNFRITNIGNGPIDSVFTGYWADGVIRNVNITPPGGTAFFNKGGNGFVDSLNLGYEFDATGDIGFTDSYMGIMLLGAELNGNCPVPAPRVNFNTWQFRNSADPLYFYPLNDVQKYGKMATGLNYLSNWDDIQRSINEPNNRSNLLTTGPFTRLNPGEYVDIAFAVVCARRVKDGQPARVNSPEQRANLLQNAGWARTAYLGEDLNANCRLDPGEDRDGNGRISRFILPAPPDAPHMRVVARDKAIDVYWTDRSESSIDPISQRQDFEGYRIYKTALGFDVQETQDILAALQLTGQWDIPDNGFSLETGVDAIRLADPVKFNGDTNTYVYRYTFDNVSNGWQHIVAVTAFDQGDEVNNLPPLESAQLASLRRVFAGKPANEGFSGGDPFVYPNPYYATAEWEGNRRFEEDRKLYFANLPPRCQVRIYTLSGDLVDVFEHDAATYTGSDTRWTQTYGDPANSTFSGGEHAWDLLSKDSQIIARGLYLFVVVDHDSGEKRRGKFAVIK